MQLKNLSSQSRASRGLTLVELLVVLAILVIIAGLLIPTRYHGRTSAYRSLCFNNLKQIFSAAARYAEASGAEAFPIGPGRSPAAHESLNLLMEHNPLLPPDVFACPSGEAIAAEVKKEGEPYSLSADTLSYAWVGKSTKLSVNRRPLSADKYVDEYTDDAGGLHDGHPDGVNGLQTDGSVDFVPLEELEEYFPATMLPNGLVR